MKKQILILSAVLIFLCAGRAARADKAAAQNQKTQTLKERQQYIHQRGAMVMPFDLNKTVHMFQKTPTGGELTVKVRDPKDADQIQLIRSHLRKEFILFDNADFSDPKTLHGADMPGLALLSKAKGQFSVRYNDLPDGAQLIFTAADPDIIDAIHMWFMAQMRDHGPDAMPMAP